MKHLICSNSNATSGGDCANNIYKMFHKEGLTFGMLFINCLFVR